MGTPDFAVPALESIISSGHNIKAVFAQPDKPAGRGYNLRKPPVKICAEKHNIPVYQPEKLKNSDAETVIKQLNPDIIVVAAYGQILPEGILSLPRLGCVNIHASLLPKLRGAAPIQWAIYNGDKITGITTMKMAKGLDTGDILEQAETDIGEDETADSLHNRLSQLGAQLIVSTLNKLENGSISSRPQGDYFTYAPLIKKDMGEIDFSKTAREIYNMIRAFTPWPSAFTTLNRRRIKVIEAAVSDKISKMPAGSVCCTGSVISAACGDGSVIDFSVIQPEGSGKMSAEAFLCGHSVELGTVLGKKAEFRLY